MKINHVVIHELVKLQHKSIEKSRIADDVLDSVNSAVITTANDVVKVYGTKSNSAHYGVFVSGAGRGNFPDELEKYAKKSESTTDEFLKLTSVAMSRLYDKASAISASSGGYLLFIDYKNNSGRYFLIAMIKLKKGITLSKNLTPKELMHLDLDRLNQAARISFSRLESYLSAKPEERFELSNYLSFVSPGSTQTASGYFVTALGCDRGTASAQATTALINESRGFFRGRSELASREKAFNIDLINFLDQKVKAKESVKLVEIEAIARKHIPSTFAEQADGLMEELLAHLNGDECAIPVEFPVSKDAVYKLSHIRGRTASWDIAFDKMALGDSPDADVFYNKATEQLTLSNIPGELKDVILKTLNESVQG